MFLFYLICGKLLIELKLGRHVMGPMFENTPTPYGKVHIYSLIISLITFVIFFMLAKKRNDKKDRIVVFIISCVLIATEIWKQVSRYKLLGRYDFAIFPAQLCSIPMFLGFIQVFIKSEKIRDVIYRYITFTGILGGLAMLLVPIVILSPYIFSTIHSLFWHIVLVAQGIYLIRARNIGQNIFKEVLPTTPILLVVVPNAIILNATPYGFNLISLSTKFVNDPPILNELYIRVPYPVYCVLVFLGLVVGLILVDLVVFLIRKIKGAIKHEN